jgi:hypothetical protein
MRCGLPETPAADARLAVAAALRLPEGWPIRRCRGGCSRTSVTAQRPLGTPRSCVRAARGDVSTPLARRPQRSCRPTAVAVGDGERTLALFPSGVTRNSPGSARGSGRAARGRGGRRVGGRRDWLLLGCLGAARRWRSPRAGLARAVSARAALALADAARLAPHGRGRLAYAALAAIHWQPGRTRRRRAPRRTRPAPRRTPRARRRRSWRSGRARAPRRPCRASSSAPCGLLRMCP